MPHYSQYTDVDVFVDVEEFYEACSEKEIEELIKLLCRDNYLEHFHEDEDKDNMLDKEYHSALDKLYGNRVNLTLEEEETIRKIASKF
jgi:hypothetical protein